MNASLNGPIILDSPKRSVREKSEITKEYEIPLDCICHIFQIYDTMTEKALEPLQWGRMARMVHLCLQWGGCRTGQYGGVSANRIILRCASLIRRRATGAWSISGTINTVTRQRRGEKKMFGTHFSYKESQDLLLARPCPLSILPLDNVTIAN